MLNDSSIATENSERCIMANKAECNTTAYNPTFGKNSSSYLDLKNISAI